MSNQIIADAGPLIAFGCIDQLKILSQLFDQIIIPKEVATECLADVLLPGAININKAIAQSIIKIDSHTSNSKFHDIPDFLGRGETAAIMLAAKCKSPLLIDEKLGRNVAIKLKLKIIGTAGILLLAKKAHIISEIHPILNLLQKNGYHLSKELIKAILKQAKE